ncbi:MAG: hypothetical protein A4S09_11330 [Proteobacteria bacterium SG_bin7]|nr:MAG: hypothetical protein A4S09_11330 [Proteobacteria bacterium SG_bin7]
MKNSLKSLAILFFIGVTGCGDAANMSNTGPAELGTAANKIKLCQDIADEQTALDITHYSESAINRKSRFPCTNSTDIWTPKKHVSMKEVGFRFVNFRVRNYKLNADQQRLEIIFVYQDNYNTSKTLSYSCEMNDKMKEWVAKEASPEC